jgi:hypothetical protein
VRVAEQPQRERADRVVRAQRGRQCVGAGDGGVKLAQVDLYLCRPQMREVGRARARVVGHHRLEPGQRLLAALPGLLGIGGLRRIHQARISPQALGEAPLDLAQRLLRRGLRSVAPLVDAGPEQSDESRRAEPDQHVPRVVRDPVEHPLGPRLEALERRLGFRLGPSRRHALPPAALRGARF